MFRVNRTGKINLCFRSGRSCVHTFASYNRCLFEFCHDGLLSCSGCSCVQQPAFLACLKKNTNFHIIVITYLRQNVQCLFCSTAITKKHSKNNGTFRGFPENECYLAFTPDAVSVLRIPPRLLPQRGTFLPRPRPRLRIRPLQRRESADLPVPKRREPSF